MWSNDKQGTIVRTSCLKEFTYKVSLETRCVDFVRETGYSNDRTEAGSMGRQGRKVSWQMLPCMLNHRVGALQPQRRLTCLEGDGLTPRDQGCTVCFKGEC